MSFVSTSTEFAMIDTRSNSGVLVLPLTTDIPGRIINIKDTYGAFTNSTLTVYTQGGEAFEDGTNFKVLNNNFDQLQVYTGSTTRWYITGGTEQAVTTTNLAVISTIQTFNWASLCNNSNTGFGSTFNPVTLGRVSLLDNVFTSSTAGLVSSFIELGNLNAAPVNMNPGQAFRWLAGVEPNAQRENGLSFRLKRWISFSNATSNSYGANLSTLQDVTVWDQVGTPTLAPTLIHTGPFVLSTLGQGITRTPGMMRFLNAGGASFIQFASSLNAGAGGNLIFGGINANPGEAMRIQTGVFGEISPGVRVGINNNNPGYTLTVGGPAVFSNVTNATGFSYGQVKLLPNVVNGETCIAFHSTLTESTQAPWIIGRSGNFGTVANFAICPFSNGGVNAATTFIFTQTGQMGIANVAPFSTISLDVNGMSRGKLFISTVTATALTVLANSYGIYHNLVNSGFNSLTLTALTGTSNFGWYVLLRNATPVAMSVTVAGTACNNIPSPLAIGSSNSVTLAWDGALFRVF